MYVVELAIRQSEQMESDHRHAGYKPAALPLSYVPECPDLSTTRDQDGGFIISYMRKIRMRKEN
jgi:hypothetical protein